MLKVLLLLSLTGKQPQNPPHTNPSSHSESHLMVVGLVLSQRWDLVVLLVVSVLVPAAAMVSATNLLVVMRSRHLDLDSVLVPAAAMVSATNLLVVMRSRHLDLDLVPVLVPAAAMVSATNLWVVVRSRHLDLV